MQGSDFFRRFCVQRRSIQRLFVSTCVITMLCGVVVADPKKEVLTSVQVMQIFAQAAAATSAGSGGGSVESLLEKFQGFSDEDWRRMGEGMEGASPEEVRHVTEFMKEMMTNKRSLEAVLAFSMLSALSGAQDANLIGKTIARVLLKIGFGYLNQEEANRLLSLMSASHARRDPAVCVGRGLTENQSSLMSDQEFGEFFSLIKSGVLRFVAGADRPLLRPSQETITMMRDEVARAEQEAIRNYSLPAEKSCAENKFLMMGLDQLIGERRDMAAHMMAWSFAGF